MVNSKVKIMNKVISKIFSIVLLLVLCVNLFGCNKVDEEKKAWAEKVVNRYARYKAGDAKAPFYYNDLFEDTVNKFGEVNHGSVVITDSQGATGIIYWVDGGYTKEEVDELISKGKKLTGLAISFADGIAVDAHYGSLKGWIY